MDYNKAIKKSKDERGPVYTIIKSQGIAKPVDNNELYEYRLLETRTITSILCLNLLQKKIEVYSQGGILINEIDFSDLCDKYGEPIKISSNGTNLLLKKSQNQLNDEFDWSTTKQSEEEK